MSLFKNPSSGGDFFKAAEHMTDLAIVLEPKRIYTEPDPFNPGQTRECCTADIAIFRDSGDVEKAEPSEVMLDAKITGQLLVADINKEGWVGEVVLVTIETTKSGRGYVWRSVTFPGAQDAAAKWFTERETARTEAAASFPFAK
jgi:hypothetical protein